MVVSWLWSVRAYRDCISTAVMSLWAQLSPCVWDHRESVLWYTWLALSISPSLACDAVSVSSNEHDKEVRWKERRTILLSLLAHGSNEVATAAYECVKVLFACTYVQFNSASVPVQRRLTGLLLYLMLFTCCVMMCLWGSWSVMASSPAGRRWLDTHKLFSLTCWSYWLALRGNGLRREESKLLHYYPT